MQIVLIIVCILLIGLVLLQSGKAESANNMLSGSSSDLFNNRKERGGELFITRFTLFLGIAYFFICIIM